MQPLELLGKSIWEASNRVAWLNNFERQLSASAGPSVYDRSPPENETACARRMTITG